ncbi:MAG: FG-GAP repeat protein, partial [Planctomycetota bacterium]
MVKLETTLVGSDLNFVPPHAGDNFGYSAGFSGNTAVVGASTHDHSSMFAAGAAYVFVRSAGTWSEQANLIASDPESLSSFGHSVAIDGDTIAVAAHLKDEPGIVNAGAVYVFVRSGSTWTQQAKLLASDFTQQVGFGDPLALSGDTLAVGSPLAPGPIAAGAVYVFVRSGTTWTQEAKLTSNVGRLAESVAIRGDTIVAGAPTHTITSFSEGVARVFRRSGTSWSEEAQLQAPDPQSNDLFGQSCAVWGDWLMVAAPRQGNTGGAVYTFERVGATWTWRQKLVSPIPEWHTTAYFGGALALRGNRVMIGAHIADIAPLGSVGRAHLYERSGSNWRPVASMTVTDPRSGTSFGKAVGLDGDVLFVTNEHGQGARKAYAYRVEPEVAFCFGDGSLATPCPCALPDFVPIPSGAPDAGCANSFDLGGARLSAGGLLAPDSLRFWADIGPSYAAFAFLVKG